MAKTPDRDVRPAPAAARRSALGRPGLLVLGLGFATLLAGGFRAAVELSDERLRPVVPVAVGAPLAAELLLLVAGVVLAAGALLIAASRRLQH